MRTLKKRVSHKKLFLNDIGKENVDYNSKGVFQ